MNTLAEEYAKRQAEKVKRAAAAAEEKN